MSGDQALLRDLAQNWVWIPGWIDAPAHPNEAGRRVLFRRLFELDTLSNSPIHIHLSADTRYKLKINNSRVSLGPARGCDKFWFYDTIDVAPFLQLGSNTIDVQVLRFFPGLFSAAEPFPRTSMPGFTIVGRVGENDLSAATSDWKVRTDYDAQYMEKYEYDYYLSTYEKIQVRTQTAWQTPLRYNLDLLHGRPTPWILHPRMIPLASSSPCKLKAIRHSQSVLSSSSWEDLLRTGQGKVPQGKHEVEIEFFEHQTAFVKLDISGQSTISLTYSEAYERVPRMNMPLPVKHDRTLRDATHGLVGPSDTFCGTGIFEPFFWRTFRFILLVVDAHEDLVINGIEYTQTNYPLNVRARFDTDQLATTMLDVSIRTLRNCMYDGYYDCPFYEQLQWCQDCRSSIIFHYLLTGDDLLAQQAIWMFAASQQTDGLLCSCYPAHTVQILPAFSLYWVSMLCDHYHSFGDAAFATQFLPVMAAVLAYFDRMTDERGLVANLPRRYWTFVDWNARWTGDELADAGTPMEGRSTGTFSFFTMLYAWTLRRAALLLRLLGDKLTATRLDSRADKASNGVKQHCFDGALFTDGPVEEKRAGYSQVAQIWGVLAIPDLDKKDKIKVLRRAFEPNTSLSKCSYPQMHYGFRALAQTSLYDEYYHRLWDPWRAMLDNHLLTWAEDDIHSRSDCHAWSSLPIYEYLQEVVGLWGIGPGFEKLLFAPRIGLYDTMDSQVVLGTIGTAKCEWRPSDNGTQVKLRLPIRRSVQMRFGDETIDLGEGVEWDLDISGDGVSH